MSWILRYGTLYLGTVLADGCLASSDRRAAHRYDSIDAAKAARDDDMKACGVKIVRLSRREAA